MTDVKDQEHLRDTISSVLEISRASWKLKNNQEAYEEEINEGDFPRSMLLTPGHSPLQRLSRINHPFFHFPLSSPSKISPCRHRSYLACMTQMRFTATANSDHQEHQ